MIKLLKRFQRKKVSHKFQIKIIDDSRRGEVVRLILDDGEIIAFPSHSAAALRRLVGQLSRRLGHTASHASIRSDKERRTEVIDIKRGW